MATQQVNTFLHAHYSVEQVAEWDGLTFTIISALAEGQRMMQAEARRRAAWQHESSSKSLYGLA